MTLTVHREGYRRKGYTRKGGVHVKSTRVPLATFQVEDRGKPGRTPESEQFYHPKVHTGWQKNMPIGKRRRMMLQAHHGDELASARAMQALANVTTDRGTRVAAQADADFFFRKHQKGLKPEHRGLRITPKTPRISR